jgi:hypothetical protein
MSEGADATKPDPGGSTAETVRTALLHLAELAAAYETRGIDVADPDNSDDDTATLTRVTALLLKHREHQRRRQRNAILGMLLRAVGEEYRTVAANEELTAFDVGEKLRATLRLFGVEPTEDELNELVIPRDRTTGVDPNELDEITIKESGGPAEAAKQALARTTGLSMGTLSEAKRYQGSPNRTAFGRWITPIARDAYLRDVIDGEKTSANESTASVATTSSADEASGRRLDALFERVSRDLFTTDTGLLALLTGAPTSPGMRSCRNSSRSAARRAAHWFSP